MTFEGHFRAAKSNSNSTPQIHSFAVHPRFQAASKVEMSQEVDYHQDA
jgi:hypothetical protein